MNSTVASLDAQEAYISWVGKWRIGVPLIELCLIEPPSSMTMRSLGTGFIKVRRRAILDNFHVRASPVLLMVEYAAATTTRAASLVHCGNALVLLNLSHHLLMDV